MSSRKDITIEIEKKYFWGFIPYFKLRRLWKGTDVTDLSYYKQPAEQEAHISQKYLTLEYLKRIEDKLQPMQMATLLHAELTKTESKND